MIQMRSALWTMLFSGVIMHMICSTNLNIAITSMVKRKTRNQTAELHVEVCHHDMGLFYSNATNSSTYSSSGHSNEILFEWTQTEKSLILSSASWFMGSAKFLGGMLCHRYGGKIVFGYSKLAVALLSFVMPFAAQHSVMAVVVIRVLQGIAAGTSLGTAGSMLISKWVPPEERGKYVSTMAGLYAGISISYFLNGWILHWFGWKAVFYISGIITIFWCICWQYFVYDTPRQHPYISTEELDYIEHSISNTVSNRKLKVPWIAIITSIPFLANIIASQGVAWLTFTFVLYFPTYLKDVHGLETYMVGQLSAIPFFLQTIFAVAFATFVDYLLIQKWLSVTVARKCATFGTLIIGGIFIGCMVSAGCNLLIAMAIFCLAAMANGTCLSGVSPNLVDLSPNFTAILTGIEGFFSSNIGFVAPIVVAYVLDKNHGAPLIAWNTIFVLSSIISIVPGIVFLVFGDSTTQYWNFGKEESSEEANDKQAEIQMKPASIMVFSHEHTS